MKYVYLLLLIGFVGFKKYRRVAKNLVPALKVLKG